MRFAVDLSYIGVGFAGFAKQPNQRTIQGELENLLGSILGEKIRIEGSGRTDRYVHARRQIVSFNTTNPMHHLQLQSALQKALPDDLIVNRVWNPPQSFHARFSSTLKHYRYLIRLSEFDFFKHQFEWQCDKKIYFENLRTVLSWFIGKHDFGSFTTAVDMQTTVREIKSVNVELSDNLITVDLIGPGFLRSMVRMIIGWSVNNHFDLNVARTSLDKLLSNPSKGSSLHKAPGCGLYLWDVFYDSQLREMKYNNDE